MTEKITCEQTDRTQLQQIIAGLDNGLIIVDPNQTISGANEAALNMHGAEKLAELGADIDSYRERFQLRYRNNHKAPDGSYPIYRVIAGEAFDEVIVEVGAPGEPPRWTHRVRGLVPSRPDGEPDCLVLIINDETARYDAEARFESNPTPAIICRVADPRYIKVIDGFIELTNYLRDGSVGRLLYDIDVLEALTDRALAIEPRGQGRTIPQIEAPLRLSGEGTKLVIVVGQPIDMGDEPRMLFTFTDLEPRRLFEEGLKHSEERFSTAFRLAPGPMTLSIWRNAGSSTLRRSSL